MENGIHAGIIGVLGEKEQLSLYSETFRLHVAVAGFAAVADCPLDQLQRFGRFAHATKPHGHPAPEQGVANTPTSQVPEIVALFHKFVPSRELLTQNKRLAPPLVGKHVLGEGPQTFLDDEPLHFVTVRQNGFAIAAEKITVRACR